MKIGAKVFLTFVLLLLALLSDGILLLPAFAAIVFIWGVKL